MIGNTAKLESSHGTILGFAESGKKIFLVWFQIGSEKLRLTDKQLKNFLLQNKLGVK